MIPQISWYNPKQTAFLVRYEPGWTWDQHRAVLTDLSRWRDSRGLKHTLCLFDLRGTTLPINSAVAPHYKDPREGSFIVIVTDNTFMRTVSQLIIRARGHQHLIHIVETLEEGKSVLDAHLAKLQSSARASQTLFP
jgi:hypothetical protein